jgi:hypothetical protein
MFLSGVLAPVFWPKYFVDNPGPPLALLTIFPHGSFIDALLPPFGEDNSATSQQAWLPRFGAPSAGVALPPTSDPAGSIVAGQVRTKELVQPPSITEHTTRLDNDQQAAENEGIDQESIRSTTSTEKNTETILIRAGLSVASYCFDSSIQ